MSISAQLTEPKMLDASNQTKSSTRSEKSTGQRTIGIVAWSLTILLSWVPNILYYEFTGNVPSWLVWAKVGLVVTFIALSFLWKDIGGLRKYALVFGVLLLSQEVWFWVRDTSWFQSLLNDMTTVSSRKLLGKFPKLAATVIMILTLFVVLRQRGRFFFAKGDSSVDIDLPQLGVPPRTSVRTFAVVFTLFAGSLSLLRLGSSLRPSLNMVGDALPLLPIIIFAALLNSFSEEVMFRASFLSVSHGVVGKQRALWMAAFVFGSAHYIGGQPSLLYGFVIMMLVGWVLGKVMLESRSILLPWAMHFATNTILFFFNEMGLTLTRF